MSEVLHVVLRESLGGLVDALGSTLGERSRHFLVDHLGRRPDEPTAVFDFGGIRMANGSYLKRTVIWSVNESARGARGEAAQICVCPVVAGLNDDLAEELDELLAGQQLPVLEALEWDADAVRVGRVRGPLEAGLRQTLATLAEHGAATAIDLHKAATDQINVTAWNNRLAELHRLRLVRRTKRGRFWVYEPTAKEVRLG